MGSSRRAATAWIDHLTMWCGPILIMHFHVELGKACSMGYIQVKHKGGGNFGRHNDERAKSGPLATSSYLLVHSKTKACELLTARFASGNPTNTNAILISKLLVASRRVTFTVTSRGARSRPKSATGVLLRHRHR